MENTDQLRAYTKLASEIWEQTGGRIGCFRPERRDGGLAPRHVGGPAPVRSAYPFCRGRAAKSAVLSGYPSGAHKIDGIGAGYVVPLWHDRIADDIERVSTAEAKAMAFRLAAEEGLFCGTSTGANVAAALRLARRLGPQSTIVAIMCDTGMKYLKAFSQDLKI